MPRARHLSSPRAAAAAVAFEVPLRARRLGMEVGLRRAARTGARVAVGPWTSEIGFELLYWVPFLRALLGRHGIGPDRVTAVSRGGPVDWYAGVAGSYADVFDALDADAVRAQRDARVTAAGHEKQLAVTPFDRRLVAELVPDAAVCVHPLAMYSRLRYWWAGDAGEDELLRRCRFARIEAPPAADLALPERYVAVKPYFSDCFPASAANRALVDAVVAELARDRDVVLLTTGMAFDDHAEPRLAAHPRVHRIAGDLDPRTNLAVQTRIVAGAEAFVATYGGPSYLGTFLDVPTVALATEAGHNPRHLQAARVAAGRLGTRAPVLVASAQAAIRAASSAGGGSSGTACQGAHASSSASE